MLLSVLAATINSRAGWQNFWKCHILTVLCDTCEDQPEKGERLPTPISRTAVVTSRQKCRNLRAQPSLKVETHFSYLDIVISLCKIHKQCAVEVFALLSFLTLESFLNMNTPWSFCSKHWVGVKRPGRTLNSQKDEYLKNESWKAYRLYSFFIHIFHIDSSVIKLCCKSNSYELL